MSLLLFYSWVHITLSDSGSALLNTGHVFCISPFSSIYSRLSFVFFIVSEESIIELLN